MKKPSFLFTLVAALLAVAPLVAADRMNVLLIISDDLRDTVGCYGNTAVKTPNIDALAARGVRFDRAYAQYPMCNPSRASFLTGLRCEQTHVVNNAVMFRARLPDIVTLPQMLRGEGWYAASYGKVFHVGDVVGEIRAGWMDVGRSWDEGMMFQTTAAGYVLQGRNLTGGKLKWCEWGATAGTDDDQPDGQTAQHAIATIEKSVAAGKPWMVAAGFHRPHDPFISPQKYFDLYPPGSLTVYHDPPDMTPGRPMTMPGGAFRQAFNAFTEQDRLEFLRAYYAGVSFTDAQVGRLMATMDRLKLWDHTLVIFTGDNGYHLNERGWWNKNTLFERSCRVPVIVVAPGGQRGAVCHSLVELLDFYPTVADYCGLTPPHPLAGTSLRSLLADPAAPGRAAAYTLVVRAASHYGQSVRTDRWRYTSWSDGTAELYDEQNDPEENHDVSAAPANAGLVASMQQLLAKIGPPKLSPATP